MQPREQLPRVLTPFGHYDVPSPGSYAICNLSLLQLKNSRILPHVPVHPRSDSGARLSVLHSLFIWDVLKDSLDELRTHVTLPKSLWKAAFSKCLHPLPRPTLYRQSPNAKYALPPPTL